MREIKEGNKMPGYINKDDAYRHFEELRKNFTKLKNDWKVLCQMCSNTRIVM